MPSMVIARIATGSDSIGTSISGSSLLAIEEVSHSPAAPYLNWMRAPVFASKGSITAVRNHFSCSPP